MAKTKGILLIALGSPLYGRMAFNLLLSLRNSSPSIPVALAYEESAITHLSEDMRNEFTHIIICPIEYFTKKGKTQYFKAKTFMYDLSPYDETLFLDADMLWLPNKSAIGLMEELSAQIDFTMSCHGYCDIEEAENRQNYSLWANIMDVKKAYRFTSGKYYGLHSEFVFFKKNKSNRTYFATAQDIYENIKVAHTDFADGIADELPFSIACIKCNKYPHKETLRPIHWNKVDAMDSVSNMNIDFYGFSMGGNVNSKRAHVVYDTLNRYYWRKAGFTSPFVFYDKKNYIDNRVTF